ncbi:unnamed protein product, partial [marine sediment metagenome]
QRVQDLYLLWQNEDGGWPYGRGRLNPDRRQNSYGSMTAAAVASLFITRDYLYPGIGCPCKGGKSTGRVPQLDKAIDGGVDWLAENFAGDRHPKYSTPARRVLYWLYACERVGLAAGLKYFGGHDWYAEGAEYLLSEQGRRSGRWGQVYQTCWAVCFLVKGRAPILFNKLKFKGLWNNHSRDVANLARYIGNLKEQPIQWQIITLEAPVEEWHDAPILYISAESRLRLTDEHKAKLRRFT